MRGMAKATVLGRMVRDPELKFVGKDNATAMARYTLAVNQYDPNSPNNEKTSFMDCVQFGKGAEWISRDTKKGDIVCASGDIEVDVWTDKDDQKKRHAWKIKVTDAQPIRAPGGRAAKDEGLANELAGDGDPEDDLNF